MLILSDKGQAIDVVTVTEELSAKKELEDVGGISYLTEIANAVPTAANIEYYANIVEEKAFLDGSSVLRPILSKKVIHEKMKWKHSFPKPRKR